MVLHFLLVRSRHDARHTQLNDNKHQTNLLMVNVTRAVAKEKKQLEEKRKNTTMFVTFSWGVYFNSLQVTGKIVCILQCGWIFFKCLPWCWDDTTFSSIHFSSLIYSCWVSTTGITAHNKDGCNSNCSNDNIIIKHYIKYGNY